VSLLGRIVPAAVNLRDTLRALDTFLSDHEADHG
jgi:hypothetical protein